MYQQSVYVYRFKPYDPNQTQLPLASAPTTASDVNIINHTNEANELHATRIPPWRPSSRLRSLHTRFNNTILYQHICIACVYCARLLYPSKAKWILYNNNTLYPLEVNFPAAELIFTGQAPSLKVPICDICNKNAKKYPCPSLQPIPAEIQAIPLTQRRFLSPVFLHCSLGRNADGNCYSEYRTLTGNIQFSKNMRAHQLYSGVLGAFLDDPPQQHNQNLSWITPQLLNAAQWLTQNNCYIKPYSQLLSNSLQTSDISEPFPTAHHSPNDPRAPPYQQRNIIVPATNFSPEIHNEDFHYMRLMAGFVQTADSTILPLSFNDPELEPLTFPDLFPNGKGHYHDSSTSTNNSTTTETYGKYIKHRLLCIDPRFRLHPYWPSWAYLQLEKLRNHQNNTRIWRQKQSDKIYKPPTAAELITKSLYTGQSIIDEQKTTTLPSFIRTGDTYFHQKLLHVNAMITEYGIPSLFITLTMAEGKWTHLQEILKYTDNCDHLPTNRPLHTTLHFIHRKQQLKKHIWKKSACSQWGELSHYFERVEFQNRGAAHTHSCIWVTKTTDEMIATHTIRSDLPDPDIEPELYTLVRKHQLHTCTHERCGGPAPRGQTCKRGFPRPFALETHYNDTQQRYIYRCITEDDQWVVPYNAPTLLIWDAHMNCQYVSSRGLGRYLTKYVVKPEPSHLFNISDGDSYREHVIARRLGSMECMFLLLGETICSSSVAVKFLPSEPPNSRQRAIRPISTIDEDDEDPYWKDSIEKYFARPHNELFEHLTYPDYFKNYQLLTKPLSSARHSQMHIDDLNYFVIRRSHPILVRFTYLKFTDGEPFFYQKLLQTISCRTESDLLGGYNSYRQHYLALNPQLHSDLILHTETTTQEATCFHQLQFNSIINSLMQDLCDSISPDMTNILTIQLDSLKRLPPTMPQTAILQLPEDQYKVLNTITQNIGPLNQKKYPYYFITGSAGTGKSYIVNIIVQWIKTCKKQNYLLMAPTGIAADNILAQTIHSTLRITDTESGFQSLVFHDSSFREQLKTVQIIIIDEVSMVSASLLTFLSNMFAYIHGNTLAFGGINVILAGDLAQLPPVKGSTVFHSSVWHIFYPLFLRQPKRQSQDAVFYNLLEEVRFGTISQRTWEILLQKQMEYSTSHSLSTLVTTTHVVPYCETADQINRIICNNLPVHEDKFLISSAIDFQNGAQLPPTHSQRDFKSKTNLPSTVRLQQGARVMFLNNSFSAEGIYNGTIGVVTDIKNIHTFQITVQVAFCVHGAIVHKAVTKQTAFFYAAGQRASRTQFPLRNAFALTVHKTQSVTLPNPTLDLHNLFAPGQAYVSLSRAKSLDTLQISNLEKESFITDPEVIQEHQRLEAIAAKPLSL